MKRVLFVIWSMGIGGAERSLVNLLTMLKGDGCGQDLDIDLFLFQKTGDFLEQLPRSVHVLDCPGKVSALCGTLAASVRCVPCLARRILFRAKYSRAVKSSYHKDQLLWEHVWKNSLRPLEGSYDVAIAYMHGIPSYFVIDNVTAPKKILWMHHDYSKLCADRVMDAPYFAAADAVATVSERCKSMLAEAFPLLEKKFIVLRNLVSPAAIRLLAGSAIPFEYHKAKQSAVPVLLSVGRLDAVKGFDIAVESAWVLKNNNREFHWFILGSGEQQERLEELIHSRGLERCFTLLGTRANPYPYLRHADVIVQTSRNEGKSVVLDEAKILCKPIVCTGYDTAADQIEDGVTGVLTALSAEGVAQGIQRMLDEPGLRDRLAANLAVADHEPDSELQEYLRCFE